jgi:hypothetical protein
MPDDVAALLLSWVGETTSSHWFDAARDPHGRAIVS